MSWVGYAGLAKFTRTLSKSYPPPFEFRGAYHLVSALIYRHPLFFAYVAANFLNRDKKVLFAYP